MRNSITTTLSLFKWKTKISTFHSTGIQSHANLINKVGFMRLLSQNIHRHFIKIQNDESNKRRIFFDLFLFNQKILHNRERETKKPLHVTWEKLLIFFVSCMWCLLDCYWVVQTDDKTTWKLLCSSINFM